MTAPRFEALPTTEDLRRLARAGGEGPCVALFTPVTADEPQARQNPMRLRRTVEAATTAMRKRGLDEARVQEIGQALDPFAAVSEGPAPGIRTRCAFATPEGVAFFGLPFEEPERAHVGACLPLRPLLRAAPSARRYRVVAVSAKRVEVLDGDFFGLEPRDVPDLPQSLEDALGAEVEGESLQFHSGASHAGDPIYHGQGGASRGREVDAERFHRVIADALLRQVPDDDCLVVLAAVQEHVAALVPRLSRWSLCRSHVTENPDAQAPHALHESAWPRVADHVAAECDALVRVPEASRARGKATFGLDDTVLAAVEGRVRLLVVPAETRMPGRIDRQSARAVPAWGDEDLCDALASLVLERGGAVTVIEPGRPLPSNDGIAAELR